MCRDVNYWKEAYRDLWSQSAAKEEMLKEIIESETGLILEPFGLGAASSAFISGSAEENGHDKDAPDFQVKGTNIFIEITGPINNTTHPKEGLWIRPAKLNYAYIHMAEAEEFFALYFPAVQEWYVIHANKEFFDHVFANKEKTDYFTIYPVIRGRQERYVEISLANPFVKDLSVLIDYLHSIK